MDPDENYREQQAIYARKQAKQAEPGDAARRSELVRAMREWVGRGGFKPRDWIGPEWKPTAEAVKGRG